MKLLLNILIFIFLVFQANISEGQKKTKFKNSQKQDRAQHAEYEFSEGMKYYVLGNLSDALSHFEAAQKLGGENAAVYFMLAKIYLYKSKNDLALQCASKAVKLSNKNKYYYELLADIYEQQQNLPEAIKTYKKLISEIPGTEEYYYNLGDIYYYLKNYDDALKAYDKIESVFGKSLPITQRKQDLFLKKGDVQHAVEEGQSLINAFPDQSEYKTAQAEFLFKNKMADKAATILEDLLKEEPENSYARLLLSDIYKSQGKTEKSDEELEAVFNNPETDLDTKLNIVSGFLKAANTDYNKTKALKLAEATVSAHPKESKAYALYGEALRRTGKKEDALNNFIKATSLDNSNYAVWLEVLGLEADMSKGDSLIKHSGEALEVFPNQAVIWLYSGLGYSLKKKYSEATESLEEGKKLSGNNLDLKNQFNLQLGDNYYYLKDYSKSDKAYEEVLKTDGSNAHALNNFSYFLSLRKEKLDQAKSMCEKLVQLFPNEATYLDTYAWVLYQMKNYQEAKKYLEKAIANSNNGTIIEHYGDVLYQLGQKDMAVDQWKKAKQLGETSDKIDQKIADKKLYE